MPELPDVLLYLARLEPRVVGRKVLAVRLSSPFVLRTVEPPIGALVGREVVGLARAGKRIVLSCAGELHLVVHLMIAGRLRWRAPGRKPPGRGTLAALDFAEGTLYLTEAGSKRRASLAVVEGEGAWRGFDAGGQDLFAIDAAEFARVMQSENHTLKRALTDPRLVSGVGNAYSDEILFRARLSPVAWTRSQDAAALERLYDAARAVLSEWTERLAAELPEGEFPERVTAFRPGMAVHGRFGEPCPVCASPVQRIRYADKETNYCATCQTGGRLLADRGLSRLLKGDWPRTLAELEERKARFARPADSPEQG